MSTATGWDRKNERLFHFTYTNYYYKSVNSEVRSINILPSWVPTTWVHGTMSEPPWKTHLIRTGSSERSDGNWIPKPTNWFRKTMQVRGVDQTPYHHELTVSSLGSVCQSCTAPLRKKFFVYSDVSHTHMYIYMYTYKVKKAWMHIYLLNDANQYQSNLNIYAYQCFFIYEDIICICSPEAACSSCKNCTLLSRHVDKSGGTDAPATRSQINHVRARIWRSVIMAQLWSTQNIWPTWICRCCSFQSWK